MTGNEQWAEIMAPYISGTLDEVQEVFECSSEDAVALLVHLIQGVTRRGVEYKSLYDKALVTLPLMLDLESDSLNNVDLAARWGTTEVAVRRARKRLPGRE